MNKAIFLDRDGTINIDYGFVHKIKDLKFIPRTFQALKRLQKLGFLLIIITNQSGIGRGYYKFSDFNRFMSHIYDRLNKKGIKIIKTYICPHHPDANCQCRKPKTYNFNNAINKFKIDISRSYVIGDKTEDIKTGKNIGAKTILVKTGKGGMDKKYKVKPDFITRNLYDASLLIKNNE